MANLEEMRTLTPADIFFKKAKTIVLWLNGSYSAHRHFWEPLWNGAAMRFITDGGANYVIPRDDLKKPDFVNGDLDSIKDSILHKCKEFHVKVIETPDQNKTDFHKALEIIVAEVKAVDAEQILILGGLSGRFDHTLGTLNTLFNGQSMTSLPIWVLDGENLLCVLSQGSTTIKIDKALITGTCGVIPFCQEKTVVTMKGFRWNLDNQEIKFGGIISTSNEVDSPTLEVTTSAPVIFTLELKPEVVPS